MKSEILFKNQQYEWIVLGRDADKPADIVDTNQYVIHSQSEALLIDPGGIEVFSSMLASVVNHLPVEKIKHIFASHQDPDVISSLGFWDKTLFGATVYAPKIWQGFLKHYGCQNIAYESIEDGGGDLLFDGVDLTFIPAHYLHSAGNFSLYDPKAKILFSGDIGAGLNRPTDPLFLSDFENNISRIKYFHQRWMSSARARDRWISRVRKLDIDYMCPQHGSIYKGADVKKFLDWFEDLEIGIAANH